MQSCKWGMINNFSRSIVSIAAFQEKNLLIGLYIRQIDGTDLKRRIYCSPRDSTWKKMGKEISFQASSLSQTAQKKIPEPIKTSLCGLIWDRSRSYFDPPMMIRNAWNSPKITLQSIMSVQTFMHWFKFSAVSSRNPIERKVIADGISAYFAVLDQGEGPSPTLYVGDTTKCALVSCLWRAGNCFLDRYSHEIFLLVLVSCQKFWGNVWMKFTHKKT